MKTLLIAGMGFVIAMAFASCGTMKGIGQDFQSLGSGIQRSAEWCTPE